MSWRTVCLLALLVTLSTLLPSGALAGSVPAITITNTTGDLLANGPFTIGWEFTTNQKISISALGIFDSSQDGLVDSYQVGIWNSMGTLLGTATVLSGTADPLVDQFRYASLTGGPITLAAGQNYEIGAVFSNLTDGLVSLPPGGATGFASDPSITFVQSSYIAGATLADPTNSASTEPSYFGPNFELSPVTSATPEPSSLLLFGTSLLGLAPFRRKLFGR